MAIEAVRDRGRAGALGGRGAQRGAEGGKAALCSETCVGECRKALETDSGGLRPQLRETLDRCRAPAPMWPVGQRAKEGRARGSGQEQTAAAAWQVDAGASGLRRDQSRWRARRRAGASGVAQRTSRGRRAAVHLPALPLGQVPRTTPGEELAESQAAGGGLRRSDKTTGGGGANRSRLQDLRADTRSRTVLVRLLSESSNGRKQKGGKKKVLSRGCFGLKLDRIGSMSGLGC